jgi:hypothetical protein
LSFGHEEGAIGKLQALNAATDDAGQFLGLRERSPGSAGTRWNICHLFFSPISKAYRVAPLEVNK